MAIVIKDFSYSNESYTPIFSNLTLIVNKGDKINLIGANGTGKSTLLKLIANTSTCNEIQTVGTCFYLPQTKSRHNNTDTIEDALGISNKRKALHNILNGSIDETDYTILNDDWDIEQRIDEALKYWDINQFSLDTPMITLSGGQQTRVHFASILIAQPDILLLDEPTNHIDKETREKFYQFISGFKGTLIVVSHDIVLLNKQNITYELIGKKLTRYPGNYDTYIQLKQEQVILLQEKIDQLDKAIKTVKTEQAKLKNKQQKDIIQNRKAEKKAGLPKIMINTFKNNAENSSAKITEVHSNKQLKLEEELRDTRFQVEQLKPFHLTFKNTTLHANKLLWELNDVNYSYMSNTPPLWKKPIHLQIRSGEHIIIKGKNGSGKSTLLNILMEELKPSSGTLIRNTNQIIYLDQFYTLLNQNFTVIEQINTYNSSGITEIELRNQLFQHGLPTHLWDKKIANLSGGECLRLAICCINTSKLEIDAILLDEPTNNLDIYGKESLFEAIAQYNGTIIVICHDEEVIKYLRKPIAIEL